MKIKNAFKTLRSKGQEIAREIYQFIRYPSGSINRQVFILGCQRSGTTMLGRCFAADKRVKEYGEFGLTDDGIRIISLADIDEVATRQHAPIMVVKPLVESQRAVEILDYFPESFGIWMVGHYKDVATLTSWRRGKTCGL